MRKVLASTGGSRNVSGLTFLRHLLRPKTLSAKRAEKDEEEKEEKEDARGRAWIISEIPRARTTFVQAPFAAPLH